MARFQAAIVSLFTIATLLYPSSLRSQVITPDSVLIGHIAEALKNNPFLSAWHSRVAAAQARVPQAGAWPDPLIGVSVMNLPVHSFKLTEEPMGSVWLEVGQAVPISGMPGIKDRIARIDLDVAELGRREQELKIVEALTQNWYEWAYQREALDILNRNIDLMDQLIQVARRKYETGKGMQHDILRAETERTRMEDMRQGMMQMILTMGRMLAAMMGREPNQPPETPHALPDSFAVIDSAALRRLFETHNPTLQRMEREVTASQSRVEMAQRDWWPELMLGAGYGFRKDATAGSDMERPDLLNVSAMVSLPLFGGRKQGQAVQEMRAMSRMSLLEQRDMELELAARFESLLDMDGRLEQQIDLYLNGVEPQAEAALAAAIASYSVGMADFESLLMAETTLYEAQRERIARVRDRLKLRASLAALVGGDE